MNAMFTDTVSSISVWFANLAAGMNRNFIRAGRTRAAAELARQGYYEEAKRLMLENQDQG